MSGLELNLEPHLSGNLKIWYKVDDRGVRGGLHEMFEDYRAAQLTWVDTIKGFRRLYGIESEEILLNTSYFGFVSTESDLVNFRRYVTQRAGIGYTFCWFKGNTRIGKVWINTMRAVREPVPKYDLMRLKTTNLVDSVRVYAIGSDYYFHSVYKGRLKCPNTPVGATEVKAEELGYAVISEINSGALKPIDIINL